MTGIVSLRHASPRDNVGPCRWPEGDEPCDYDGRLVKGLCPSHYNRLTRRLLRAGIRRRPPRDDDRPGPMVCVCATPHPRPVRIIGGTVLIADALECTMCGRAVL